MIKNKTLSSPNQGVIALLGVAAADYSINVALIGQPFFSFTTPSLLCHYLFITNFSVPQHPHTRNDGCEHGLNARFLRVEPDEERIGFAGHRFRHAPAEVLQHVLAVSFGVKDLK